MIKDPHAYLTGADMGIVIGVVLVASITLAAVPLAGVGLTAAVSKKIRRAGFKIRLGE